MEEEKQFYVNVIKFPTVDNLEKVFIKGIEVPFKIGNGLFVIMSSNTPIPTEDLKEIHLVFGIKGAALTYEKYIEWSENQDDKDYEPEFLAPYYKDQENEDVM